jgi:hypothetical protein
MSHTGSTLLQRRMPRLASSRDAATLQPDPSDTAISRSSRFESGGVVKASTLSTMGGRLVDAGGPPCRRWGDLSTLGGHLVDAGATCRRWATLSTLGHSIPGVRPGCAALPDARAS